jgi:nucleoside-diphosphate-sugar epimerase
MDDVADAMRSAFEDPDAPDVVAIGDHLTYSLAAVAEALQHAVEIADHDGSLERWVHLDPSALDTWPVAGGS